MTLRDSYIPCKEIKWKSCKEKEKEREKLSTLTTRNDQGKFTKGSKTSGTSGSKSLKAAYRKKDHRITRCDIDMFKANTINERMQFLITLKMKLCQICLWHHELKDFSSTCTCFIDGCNKKHNTLLHTNSPTVHVAEHINTHV